MQPVRVLFHFFKKITPTMNMIPKLNINKGEVCFSQIK